MEGTIAMESRGSAGETLLPLTPPALAEAAAAFFKRFHASRHRGVHRADHMLVVFGNDGYSTDGAAAKEVRLVRRAAGRLGLEERSFGVERTGYSWAVVYTDDLNPDTPARLTEALRDAALQSFGGLTGGVPPHCS